MGRAGLGRRDGTTPPDIGAKGHHCRSLCREIRLVELLDGQIVAAGETLPARRTRAYIADPQLHAWSILVDGAEHETHASLFPMEWGALLSTGVRMWRFTIGTEGWHRLEAAIPLSAAGIAVRPWGDEVLLTYQEAGRWTASIINRAGQLRPTAALPNAGASFDLTAIGTSSATNMWLLSADKQDYLWRRPDEPPIALPPDLIRLSSKIVATDDEHLLGVARTGPLVEVALNGSHPPGHACDGLLRYLSGTPAPRSYGSEFGMVSVECRQDARRGDAPAVLALVRSWAAASDRADVGRAFECALQDEHAVGELTGWFGGRMDEHAKAVCYESLASWPRSDDLWKPALDGAIYKKSDRWYVDGAVIRVGFEDRHPRHSRSSAPRRSRGGCSPRRRLRRPPRRGVRDGFRFVRGAANHMRGVGLATRIRLAPTGNRSRSTTPKKRRHEEAHPRDHRFDGRGRRRRRRSVRDTG